MPKLAARCGATSRGRSPDGCGARYARSDLVCLTPSDLSRAAVQFVRNAVASGKPVYISAISLVETIYLVERGRISFEALQRIEAALKDISSGLIVVPLDAAIAEAVPKIPRTVVPDMPDRIIAATALHLGLPLVTRDERIHSAGIRTI